MGAERRFHAMGTEVHLIVHGPDELVDVAHQEILRLEQLWSRFLPDSEVSLANRHAGTWVAVSPETGALVSRALEGWSLTAGLFDPTVLGDVIRSGYDRTFEELAPGPDQPSSPLGRDAAGVAVDRTGLAVRVPAGVGFDPGGLGKGLAADLVAERLDAEGAAGALVNIGGDLRAVGCGPGGEDWTVDIDPAATGRPLATVVLDQGALATSTILRRHWQVAGRPRHHLIDPATGDPADHGVVAATVVAATGWQAEVLAKVAVVGGFEAATTLLARLGADALFVDAMGSLHRTAGFDRFVVPDPSSRSRLAATETREGVTR